MNQRDNNLDYKNWFEYTIDEFEGGRLGYVVVNWGHLYNSANYFARRG